MDNLAVILRTFARLGGSRCENHQNMIYLFCSVESLEAKMMRALAKISFLTLALMSVAADAAETIAYTYDARGRVIAVALSGTVNNGVNRTYTIDKADNRTNKTTTGSPNPPPP